MSAKPGRLTLKNREGYTTLTATSLETSARHVVLSIASTHTAIESAVAVEGLAQHLTRVAEWMRAQEVATRKAIDDVESVFNTLREYANRSPR